MRGQKHQESTLPKRIRQDSIKHSEDPKTAVDVRFIEVKGRAYHGEIALTLNDYRTAHRLGKDYYLHVVLDCAAPNSVPQHSPRPLHSGLAARSRSGAVPIAPGFGEAPSGTKEGFNGLRD